MSEINTGGPAFPVVAENGLGHVSSGVTVRDYFAAQALQGICANHVTWGLHVDEIAKWAYSMADKMLTAREQ